MKTNAENFFSDQDRESIKKAIQTVEGTTSGEVAVMAVDQSDAYREGAALGGVIFAGLISLAACIVAATVMVSLKDWSHGGILSHFRDALPLVTVWYFIPVMGILYFPFRWILMKTPHLRLAFVSTGRRAEAVRERTIRAFYEKGLYRTRDETGILVFLSLLERRVWILGDRGINEKIPEGFWEERAMEITAGIRSGARGSAVADAVLRCRDELAKFFPKKPGDTNELPDDVML